MSQYSKKFNSSKGRKVRKKKKMAIAQDLVIFLCISCCEHACIYMDNPFPVSCQKNCYISTLFLFQLKIYFLQAEGSPSNPPLTLSQHYLYMLRQTPTAVVASVRKEKKIKDMKNEDMLTKMRG